MRHPAPEPPEETGVRDGLAYALFVPKKSPAGGVVVLHGPDSRREKHLDFGRACRSTGPASPPHISSSSNDAAIPQSRHFGLASANPGARMRLQ
jgi:hypothetical protein